MVYTNFPPPPGFSTSPTWDGGRSVLVRTDGKLVVAGQSWYIGDFSRGALARYWPDGTLDTSFGPANDGKVTFDWDDNLDRSGDEEDVKAAALYEGPDDLSDNDDRIIVAGDSQGTLAQEAATGRDFRLSIFDGDGALLHEARTDFNAAADLAHGVVLQCVERDQFGGCAETNMRIVVVGYSAFIRASTEAQQYDWAIARYKMDATPDTCFGPPPEGLLAVTFPPVSCENENGVGNGTGRVLTDFGERDQATNPVRDRGRAVTVQQGAQGQADRVVVAGEVFGDDFGVAAYGKDGNLDGDGTAGFGPDKNGKLRFTFTASSLDEAKALAVDSSGRIVVGGRSLVEPSRGDDFALARLTARGDLTGDGVLDPTFRERDPALPDLGDGKVYPRDLGQNAIDIAGGVGVDAGGRVVLGGYSRLVDPPKSGTVSPVSCPTARSTRVSEGEMASSPA